MKKGILASVSAGNESPHLATLSNYAPWTLTLTVAASLIDRKFVAKVKLGDGKMFEGLVINTFGLYDRSFPLIYERSAPCITGGWNSLNSRFCLAGSLDDRLVKGKIVVCIEGNGFGPLLAGATGAIVLQDGSTLPFLIHCQQKFGFKSTNPKVKTKRVLNVILRILELTC